MNYDVVVTTQPTLTRVKISGHPTIDELLAFVHLLGVESGGWTSDVLLVDLRAVVPLFDRNDQFKLGQAAAASLMHLRKIASVVPTERITRVSEKAAKRDGVQLCVFDSEREALAWLREP